MKSGAKRIYLGGFSALVTVCMSLVVYILQIPNPMMILIIPVVYFTYVGGWGVGIMSGGVSFAYSLFFFSNKGELFSYDSVSIQKIATIVVCLATIITLMGKLKKREKRYTDELASLNKTLESFAFFDPLTNAFNRHALVSHFGNPDTAPATGLSFALLDLDHFKAVNDRYGHVVGDQMLKHVVEQFWKVIPSNAHLYRWGGEEFLLIVKSGDKDEVLEKLERIRWSVQENPLQSGCGIVTITVSIGYACATGNSTIKDCISLADQRLYAAKNAGRNRVVSG